MSLYKHETGKRTVNHFVGSSMKLHGSHVVIICCFLLEFPNILHQRDFISLTPYFGILINSGMYTRSAILIIPTPGSFGWHLPDQVSNTEVWVSDSHHRSSNLNPAILYLTSVADLKSITVHIWLLLSLIIVAIVATGTGLFEANAIQFWLDQLLEAPTPKVVAFIHWYTWSQNFDD